MARSHAGGGGGGWGGGGVGSGGMLPRKCFKKIVQFGAF